MDGSRLHTACPIATSSRSGKAAPAPTGPADDSATAYHSARGHGRGWEQISNLPTAPTAQDADGPPSRSFWGTLQHSYGYEQQPDGPHGSSSHGGAPHYSSSATPHGLSAAVTVKLEPGASDMRLPRRCEQQHREEAWRQDLTGVQEQAPGLGHESLRPPQPPAVPLSPPPLLRPPQLPLLPPPPPLHAALRHPQAGCSGPFQVGALATACPSTSPALTGSPPGCILQPSPGSSPSPAALLQPAGPARPTQLRVGYGHHQEQLRAHSGVPASERGQPREQQQQVMQAGGRRDRSEGESELGQKGVAALVEAHAIAPPAESVVLKYVYREFRLPAAARAWFPRPTGTGAGRLVTQVYGRGSSEGQWKRFEVKLALKSNGTVVMSCVAGVAKWVGISPEGQVRLRRCGAPPGELVGLGVELGPVVVVERAEAEEAMEEQEAAAGPMQRACRQQGEEEAQIRQRLCVGGSEEQLQADTDASTLSGCVSVRSGLCHSEQALWQGRGVVAEDAGAGAGDGGGAGASLHKRRRLLGTHAADGEVAESARGGGGRGCSGSGQPLPHVHLQRQQQMSDSPRVMSGPTQQQAQQQLCFAGSSYGHLPAASLTAAHLPSHVPPATGPPPLQPGELRLCGLTFHPDMAPGVRRAIDTWMEGLRGTPLDMVDPCTLQVQVLVLGAGLALEGGTESGAAGAAVGTVGTAAAAAAAATAGRAAEESAGTLSTSSAARSSADLIQRHGLRPAVLAARTAELLGLADVEAWGRALPQEAPVQGDKLERRRDEQRGGWGLWAKGAVKKSHPLGVVGGYVMPAGVGSRFVASGLKHCPEEVREELRGRVEAGDGGGGGGGAMRLSYGWKMLAASYCMPYLGVQAPGGCRPAGAAPAPAPVLCLLGYGSLAALANDPRVNPRAWQEGNDVEATHEQLQPNCGVVYVSVRGLVLPVLVALRDIAPGEQLLRDYGAAWWRGIAPVWEVAEDEGLGVERLFGAGQQGASV